MRKDHPSQFHPASDDNKRVADEVEGVVVAASSIEEEMLLEAADLEELEMHKPRVVPKDPVEE